MSAVKWVFAQCKQRETPMQLARQIQIFMYCHVGVWWFFSKIMSVMVYGKGRIKLTPPWQKFMVPCVYKMCPLHLGQMLPPFHNKNIPRLHGCVCSDMIFFLETEKVAFSKKTYTTTRGAKYYTYRETCNHK